MFGRTSLHENHPSREGQGQKGSKTFNNRFDFERGLWWQKTGQEACAPQTSVW